MAMFGLIKAVDAPATVDDELFAHNKCRFIAGQKDRWTHDIGHFADAPDGRTGDDGRGSSRPWRTISSWRGVRIQPGEMQLTRTPWGAHSVASERVNCNTPPFEAA